MAILPKKPTPDPPTNEELAERIRNLEARTESYPLSIHRSLRECVEKGNALGARIARLELEQTLKIAMTTATIAPANGARIALFFPRLVAPIEVHRIELVVPGHPDTAGAGVEIVDATLNGRTRIFSPEHRCFDALPVTLNPTSTLEVIVENRTPNACLVGLTYRYADVVAYADAQVASAHRYHVAIIPPARAPAARNDDKALPDLGDPAFGDKAKAFLEALVRIDARDLRDKRMLEQQAAIEIDQRGDPVDTISKIETFVSKCRARRDIETIDVEVGLETTGRLTDYRLKFNDDDRNDREIALRLFQAVACRFVALGVAHSLGVGLAHAWYSIRARYPIDDCGTMRFLECTGPLVSRLPKHTKLTTAARAFRDTTGTLDRPPEKLVERVAAWRAIEGDVEIVTSFEFDPRQPMRPIARDNWTTLAAAHDAAMLWNRVVVAFDGVRERMAGGYSFRALYQKDGRPFADKFSGVIVRE